MRDIFPLVDFNPLEQGTKLVLGCKPTIFANYFVQDLNFNTLTSINTFERLIILIVGKWRLSKHLILSSP